MRMVNQILAAINVLLPGERAVVLKSHVGDPLLTHDSNGNISGSGNWLVKANLHIQRVIIYVETQGPADVYIGNYAGQVQVQETRPNGRTITKKRILLTNTTHSGITHTNWKTFVNTTQWGVGRKYIP